MIKQFVAPIVLLLALVTVAACGGAPASLATPATQRATRATQRATSTAQDTATPNNKPIQPPTEGILDIDEKTPLCVIFPTLNGDGQQYDSRGTENGDGLAAAGLSHGEIVFHTIVDEMGSSNVTSDTSVVIPDNYRDGVVILVVDNFIKPSKLLRPIAVPKKALNTKERILIVGVDIGSWEINVVKEKVKDAIRDLISDPSNPVVRRFVINMSFALVPCNEPLKRTLEQYVRGDPSSLADFSRDLSALIDYTYGKGYANIPSQITTGDFAEFTRCLSKEYPEDDKCDDLILPAHTYIILVGAAGNAGYPFPFAPALFDHVVSVSASNSDGSKKAGYSNAGEVMMPGTTKFSYNGQNVVGTSFASPRLAVAEAEYLLSIPDTRPDLVFACQGYRHKPVSPPLGYIPEEGGWGSPFQTDLPLREARAQYCPYP